MDKICSSRFECIWAHCISGESICFLIWLREHASVAIFMYLLIRADAIPVRSAIIAVLVIPTPPHHIPSSVGLSKVYPCA